MDNTLHLVGIAKKARRVEVGEEPVGAAARARQARLIVLARDAADNTCRRAAHFAEAGACPVVQCPYSKEELGGAVGRTSCAMLAFTDAGLAASFMGKLSARDAERYGETAEAVSAKARSGTARRPRRCPPRRPDCSSASGSSAATSRSCKRPGQSPGLLPPPAARSAVWPSGAGAHRARAGRRTRSPGSRAEILWAAARPWPVQWKIFAIEPPQSRGFAGRGEAGKRRGRFPPPRRRASSDVKERR